MDDIYSLYKFLRIQPYCNYRFFRRKLYQGKKLKTSGVAVIQALIRGFAFLFFIWFLYLFIYLFIFIPFHSFLFILGTQNGFEKKERFIDRRKAPPHPPQEEC